jgi:hypothetical protein
VSRSWRASASALRRLLSLFRLIHKGHGSRFVQMRGGKLFDPDAFPFLEGRDISGLALSFMAWCRGRAHGRPLAAVAAR